MTKSAHQDPHPVKAALLARIAKSCGNTIVEKAILHHGRPFIGVDRPKHFRLGKIKECFVNAGVLADAGRGIYVEGFITTPVHSIPIHHAWITLDGVHAVDVTLREPAPNCSYFGIPFSSEVLQSALCRLNCWGPFIDAADEVKEFKTFLSKVISCPPSFPRAQPLEKGLMGMLLR
jgi:hypothetical protein